MTERGIIFGAPMVRAILANEKTMTRRIAKRVPSLGEPLEWCPRAIAQDPEFLRIIGDYRRFCPYGTVGDRLWVRETHLGGKKPEDTVWYRATEKKSVLSSVRWTPSIYMHKWASRISLEIVDVRVERLQDISEQDARAEGISEVTFIPDDGFPPSLGYMVGKDDGQTKLSQTARMAFEKLWDSINGKKHPWSANDYLWVVVFRRIESERKAA